MGNAYVYTERRGGIVLLIAGFVNNYIRIYLGKESRQRIQTDMKVAVTNICG
jgi:hypothetical protein